VPAALRHGATYYACPATDEEATAQARKRLSLMLASGEPVDFLGYVSTLLAAVDPPGQNPFERVERPERVTLRELAESFADVALPETTALLAAIAEPGPGRAGPAGGCVAAASVAGLA